MISLVFDTIKIYINMSVIFNCYGVMTALY